MIKGTLQLVRRDLDVWSGTALAWTALLVAPLAVVVAGLGGAGPKWDHVAETVLWGYVANTGILLASVGLLSALLAIPPAWLVSAFEFPGRRFFEWALVMPLAIPTYVAAIVYYQVPEAAIPLLVRVRAAFGVETFLAAESFLRYGVLSLILAGVVFPYLYLSARASFSQQQRQAIEAAQTLGRGPGQVFFTVALPMARPALAAGFGLIAMEVINDYGAVHLFGVPTLTEGIFRTWFGLEDRASALRLAGLVMLGMMALLWAEQLQRGRARFADTSSGAAVLSRRRLTGRGAWGALAVCLVPVALGFLLPVAQLGLWAARTWGTVLRQGFGEQLVHSLMLALGTAVMLTGVALWMSYANRVHRTRWLGGATRLATMGYAAPGAVVAVGVMVIGGLANRWLAGGTGFWTGATLATVVFAYAVRFLAVAFHPVKAGMERICGTLDEASRMLGRGPGETLVRINAPLLGGTLGAALLLVFVDILKELPLTMILRPANFETLATAAFGLAKEGRIHECAVPSLFLVMAGGASLAMLHRLWKRFS